MKFFKFLVEYLGNDNVNAPRNVFWITLEEQQDRSYLMCLMLIKDLQLEENEPFGFNNKNHTAKYKINLKPIDQGFFVAEPVKVEFNKLLFSLSLRCFISAWEHWKDPNFSGIEFAKDIETERKNWFPSPNINKSPHGDLELVLETTKVLKV